MFTRRFKQLGQGMTEYIIIVALIAIAAITAYSFFGETLRSQVGGISQELAGDSTSAGAAITAAGTSADSAQAEGTKSKKLGDYKN